MAVTRIVDGDLSIDIMNERVSRELTQFDLDRDGVVDVRKEMAAEKLPISYCAVDDIAASRSFVTNLLRDAGEVSSSQQAGAARFFEFYNKMKRVNEMVERWKANHTDTWGSELEFNSSYWNTDVVPHLMGAGIFGNFPDMGSDAVSVGPGIGFDLSGEMFNVMNELCGAEWGMKKNYTIDSNRAPAFLRGQLREVIGWYNGLRAFLNGYSELECEGKGCAWLSEYSIFEPYKVEDVAVKG